MLYAKNEMDGLSARRQARLSPPNKADCGINGGIPRFEPDVCTSRISKIRRWTVVDGMGPCEDGRSRTREFH